MAKKSFTNSAATTPTTAQHIAEARKELARMRMSHALEPLKNPTAITKKKREIARTMTLLNQQKQQNVTSYGN